MTPPPNRFVNCLFCTPIGVKDVCLNGSEISGTRTQRRDCWNERGLTLAQRFANQPQDPKSIFQFTQRWGPLHGNIYDNGETFSFSIDSWIRSQIQFRESWVMVQRLQRAKRDFSWGVVTVSSLETVHVEHGPKGPILRCPDLYTFMSFELHGNGKALRVCKRTDCPMPYFLAQHGKELYCSTKCANWAQSIWKKRWHEERRKERTKARKTDGTQKAR